MRSNEARIAEMHTRAMRYAQMRSRRCFRAVCAAASLLCLSIIVVAACYVLRVTPEISVAAPAVGTASIFTDSDALGYVFIAVIAFLLGVVLTLFCFRLKRRLDEKERRNDRKL